MDDKPNAVMRRCIAQPHPSVEKKECMRIPLKNHQITYMIVEIQCDRSVIKYKWFGTVVGKIKYTLETIGIKMYEHENGTLLVIIPFNSKPHMQQTRSCARILFRVFPPRNCNNGNTIKWEIDSHMLPCPGMEPGLFHIMNPDFNTENFDVWLTSNFMADLRHHEMHDLMRQEHWEQYHLRKE